RTSDVPQRVADGSRDAENDAARRLARDDDPVTGTARRAFGCDGCGALDSKRLQPFIVRRVLRVGCAPTIYRERYFTLIPSSKAQHAAQHAIEIQHRVGVAYDTAILLNLDFDLPSLDIDRHAFAGGSCRCFPAERPGHRFEPLLVCSELL